MKNEKKMKGESLVYCGIWNK